MAVRHQIEGYDEFCKFSEGLKDFDFKTKSMYVLFSGSKLPSGENWCSDCSEAYPVIQNALELYADSNTHFVYVEVGDRPYWKDLRCPWRVDPRLTLKVIPTLIKWKTPKRLEGVEQCGKLDLLELLFTDDD